MQAALVELVMIVITNVMFTIKHKISNLQIVAIGLEQLRITVTLMTGRLPYCE